MSAEIVWSIIGKSAKYTKKQNGTVFSWNSVDNMHKASTAVAARRRTVNVVGGKLQKVEADKVAVHRVKGKRTAKLLQGYRTDAIRAVNKKARFQKRACAKKASAFVEKKAKKQAA